MQLHAGLTFQQLQIVISNQWREFEGELLEYYIRYTIWSWRFLDFCLPKGDVGFTHGYKEIGGIAPIRTWMSDTSEGESGVNPAVRMAKKLLKKGITFLIIFSSI